MRESEASRRQLTQGFTLVELLVALVLVGLLAVVLFGGLSVGIQTWERVTARHETSNHAFLVQTLFRRLLEDARSIRVRDQDGQLQATFRGSATELVFVAPDPRSRKVEELVWIGLSFTRDHPGAMEADDTEDEAQQALVMRTTPFVEEELVDWDLLMDLLVHGQGEQGDQAVLLKAGLLGGGFEYLPLEEDSLPDWQDEWEEMMQIPELIKISFDVLEREEGFWKELTIAPRENAYAVKESF